MRGRPVDMQRCLRVFDYIIEYKSKHDGNTPGAGMIRLGDGHCSVEVVGGQWHLEDPFSP